MSYAMSRSASRNLLAALRSTRGPSTSMVIRTLHQYTSTTLTRASMPSMRSGLKCQSERIAPIYRLALVQQRGYADVTVKVPGMGDSITEGTLKQWNKQVGDYVEQDEEVVSIETDKIDVPVNAPSSGKITKLFYSEEDTVAVGADLFALDSNAAKPEGEAAAPAPKKEATPPPPPRSEPTPAAPSKPATTTTTTTTTPPPSPRTSATPSTPAPSTPAPKPSTPAPSTQSTAPESTANKIRFGQREERRVKMNRMRTRIAERLKESQNTAASLTTFNEIDMTNIMNLRSTYKDAVLKKHGVKLGFMSAFVRASCIALSEVPMVNASIEGPNGGDTIVYRDYADISVAVATPKGLVTPVLRNAESMSFVEVEQAINELGVKARENKLTLEDMTGGTFTISNGGVFGSLMGTPIINMPQSAILGMHAIKERPVAVNGKVEIRPMMYVALTYDHRLIDGREAVTFLIKVKEAVEDPRRLLLNV